jgi:hypothetical protein
MSKEASPVEVVCTGTRVILRDGQISDAEAWVRWMSSGEWREYDAPWELVGQAHLLQLG